MRRWISLSHVNYFVTVLKKEWSRACGRTTATSLWYVGSVGLGSCPPLLRVPRDAFSLSRSTGLSCILSWHAAEQRSMETPLCFCEAHLLLSLPLLRKSTLVSSKACQRGEAICLPMGRGVLPLLLSCLWELGVRGSWSPGQANFLGRRKTRISISFLRKKPSLKLGHRHCRWCAHLGLSCPTFFRGLWTYWCLKTTWLLFFPPSLSFFCPICFCLALGGEIGSRALFRIQNLWPATLEWTSAKASWLQYGKTKDFWKLVRSIPYIFQIGTYYWAGTCWKYPLPPSSCQVKGNGGRPEKVQIQKWPALCWKCMEAWPFLIFMGLKWTSLAVFTEDGLLWLLLLKH